MAGTIKGAVSSSDPWDSPTKGPRDSRHDHREPTKINPENNYPPPTAPPTPPPPATSKPLYEPIPTARPPHPPVTKPDQPEVTPRSLSSPLSNKPEPSTPVKPAPSSSNNNKFKSTYDPSREKRSNHSFILIPVMKQGEDERPGIQFKEDCVQLNRGNTDTENYTITSRVQAKVEFVDGHWFIQDQSDQETTFIQLKRPFQLQNGDIIQLGDRKFIFHSED